MEQMSERGQQGDVGTRAKQVGDESCHGLGQG